MGLFDRLFGRPGSGAGIAADGGLYLYVRCNACGEVIRARINPAAELSLADDESGTYFARKVLVGQRCYRPIEITVRYADLHGREVERTASGGTFVDGPEPDPDHQSVPPSSRTA